MRFGRPLPRADEDALPGYHFMRLKAKDKRLTVVHLYWGDLVRRVCLTL